MSEQQNASIPEHDRMAEVLSKTLEPGGEPAPRELAEISTRVRLEAAKAAALTIQRIGPNAAETQSAKKNGGSANWSGSGSGGANAELLQLRKWVLRAWIAAALGMLTAAGVAIYCSIRFTRPETVATVSAQPGALPQHPDERKESVAANPNATSTNVALSVPADLVHPPGSDHGLWGAVPRSAATTNGTNGTTATNATNATNGANSANAVKPTETIKSIAARETPVIPPRATVDPIAPVNPESLPIGAPKTLEITPTPPPPPPAAAVMPSPGDDLIVVVMGGVPVEGFPVLPATEENFKLKLRDTSQTLTFRWNSLEDMERRRIKKLYGMEESSGRPVYGEKVAGARLRLVSGKTLDALPLPPSDANGQRAFRTANAPMLLIPAADIKSEEPLACYESDFFTKRDIYERWIQDKPPAPNDAAAYLELARKCATTGLFTEALDCLKSAEVIDPRTAETNRDLRVQIVAEQARAQALDIYETALRARGNKDFFTAAECLEKLDRNFPNSELKSRWDALRADIEKGAKQELRKRVTEMAYPVALELIRRQMARRLKLDAKGNVVASIPGKQISTTHGHIFRGTLQPSDGAGVLTLKVGDMELAIPRNEIVSVDDVDLSTGVKEVPQSFDDLRDYVSDSRRPDGLKAQTIAAIARSLRGIGVTEKDVREIFDHRLDRPAIYVDGKIISNPVYASIQDAAYGKGSWLRDGATPLPLTPDDADPLASTARPRNSKGQPYASGKPDENAELSDDPNVWWPAQTSDTQFAILRAISAEKIFSAKVTELRCNECAGTGVVTISGPGNRPATYRCPQCRGLKVLFKITYE